MGVNNLRLRHGVSFLRQAQLKNEVNANTKRLKCIISSNQLSFAGLRSRSSTAGKSSIQFSVRYFRRNRCTKDFTHLFDLSLCISAKGLRVESER